MAYFSAYVPPARPELPQQFERRFRQRNVAILRALAAMHVHHHPVRVDIAHVQIESFFQSYVVQKRTAIRCVVQQSMIRWHCSIVSTSGSDLTFWTDRLLKPKLPACHKRHLVIDVQELGGGTR